MSTDSTSTPSVDDVIAALRSSSTRLETLVESLDTAQLRASAYPTEWTVADTLSHLGSGSVINLRYIDDSLAGLATPDDFAPSVWDEWNAKSPEVQAADALVAGRAFVERCASLTPAQRDAVSVPLGPMTLDLATLLGMRLNEHALHSWDVAVAIDPKATVPTEAAELVIDSMGMIIQYTGKPVDEPRVLRLHTTDPVRDLTITLGPDAVSVSPADDGAAADLTLPAEAFIRVVYGRLDPDHTPPVDNPAAVDELRAAFPGV